MHSAGVADTSPISLGWSSRIFDVDPFSVFVLVSAVSISSSVPEEKQEESVHFI